MRTVARQRAGEVLLDSIEIDEAVVGADAVDDADGAGDEVRVAVLLEPVEGRARGPRAVEARRDDDDDLVGRIEDPAGRRLQHARAGVEADEVVVALEQADRPPELLLAERLRDPRVVVRGDDLEPGRRLRGVAADVRVPLDLVRRRRAATSTVAVVSRRTRWPSVPASGLPSSATTRSPR